MRMLSIPLCMAACAAALSAFADDVAVTAEADSAISVDLREDVCRAIGSAEVGYSPKWGGVTNEGAYVVLEKVLRVGLPGESTNTVAAFAADAESCYSYVVSDGDERCVRFIHRVYSSDNVEIGEPLVRDVEFGYRSAFGGAFVADSRTNSLQEAVMAGNVNLAYDTGWATNAAAVSISVVKISGVGGAPVTTNAVFSANADVDGTTPMRGVNSGWWRLICQMTDVSGEVLLEYTTGDFKRPGGLAMCFR